MVTDIGSTSNNLGLLYVAQGRYGDAQRLFERALDICTKLKGPHSASTASARNNLAMALYYQVNSSNITVYTVKNA